MAVAIRSQTSTTYASRTNTVLTAPTGLANDDILFAVIFNALTGTPSVPTPPAGFTQIGTSTADGAGGFNDKFSLFWKRAASESGSYTFTHAAASSQGLLLAISGAATSGSPVDVFSSNSSNTGSTSTGLSVTTTVANDLLLYIEHDWEGLGTLSPPTGMTEVFDSLIYAASLALGAAGATGNKTQTNGNGGGNPWAAWLVAIAPAGSGSPYTLTAASGSFGLTGQAARLAAGRKLPSAAGSFALTGVAAGLKAARKVAAATGAFNLTGQAVSLKAARKLPASPGAFALTGINATLTYTPAGTKLIASPGSFTLTGQPAALRVTRKLALASGPFALSGQAAGLRYGRVLSAGSGSFALTGNTASLRAARKIVAAKGSFVLTGFAAALSKTGTSTYALTCNPASFLLTGYDASLIYAPIIGKTNPLGRLNMYTGTLGAMSNREDWIENIEVTDDKGVPFDISAAQSIGVYVCRAGCPNDPILAATLGSGIVLTDNFTFQWAFTENDMQRLHPSQYDVFCRVEIGNITTQVLSASISIVEGGPRQ